jgi:uncharacterized membrane protein YhaH (DUF805 family)
MNWYMHVLQNYFKFDGRARRAEYWTFFLINVAISIALTLVGNVIGTTMLPNIYGLAVLIPGIAVAIRRMHDTGRSGWWLLIGLIPLLGWIAVIYFLAQDSEPGDNQYGPNPKTGVAFS